MDKKTLDAVFAIIGMPNTLNSNGNGTITVVFEQEDWDYIRTIARIYHDQDWQSPLDVVSDFQKLLLDYPTEKGEGYYDRIEKDLS